MAGKLDVDPQQPENAALERELRCLYATLDLAGRNRGAKRARHR
jgi:hypothetical protein